MKVALVYDRINKFGGAERLLLSLHRLYPEAPIYTLVHEASTSQWAKSVKVIPTFLNQLRFLRKRHEWLAPIAPLAFETLNFSAFDLIISLTSGDAKSILTRPHQLHICYCLTPTRYFWSGEGEYSKDKKVRLLPGFLKNYLKFVDLLTATRPDHYLTISREVQNRVKNFYNRKSSVVYPSIEDKFYSINTLPAKDRHYFLAVGRLVPYKKFDLIVKAFNKLKLPLIIAGSGSELSKLKKIAGKNITFDNNADDTRLIEYYRHAKAVIFPQDEDFGLVPLEAQASGTPVIAYGHGGALETVIHGETGYLFAEQTSESLASAVKEFQKLIFDPQKSIQNAKKFSFAGFSKQFTEEVARLFGEHQKSL